MHDAFGNQVYVDVMLSKRLIATLFNVGEWIVSKYVAELINH